MIDDIMEAQEQRLLPQGGGTGQIDDMQDSLLYGGEVDSALVKKSGNTLTDVRNFLQLLLRQEQVYRVKVDCIQKNLGGAATMAMPSPSSNQVTQIRSKTGADFAQGGALEQHLLQLPSQFDNIIFTFKVNKRFYFTKTLIEVEKFCTEYTKQIRNPLVQGIGELFTQFGLHQASLENSNAPAETSMSDFVNDQKKFGARLSNENPMNLSLGGVFDISKRYQILHQELETTSLQLAGYLKHILNDPDLYCDLVYKFFNCHQLFQMLPQVAAFRDQNRVILSQHSTSIKSLKRQTSTPPNMHLAAGGDQQQADAGQMGDDDQIVAEEVEGKGVEERKTVPLKGQQQDSISKLIQHQSQNSIKQAKCRSVQHKEVFARGSFTIVEMWEGSYAYGLDWFPQTNQSFTLVNIYLHFRLPHLGMGSWFPNEDTLIWPIYLIFIYTVPEQSGVPAMIELGAYLRGADDNMFGPKGIYLTKLNRNILVKEEIYKHGNSVNLKRPRNALLFAAGVQESDDQMRLPRGTLIQEFLGIEVSCKVKGQQIQIFDSAPTNIFTVEITKKVNSAKDTLPKKELWLIKVSIGQIIELANQLNIKYSVQDRSLPNLEISLIEFQNQLNQSFTDQQNRVIELEAYLNSLLQTDTLLFTLSLRVFFQFDQIKRKAAKKQARAPSSRQFPQFTQSPIFEQAETGRRDTVVYDNNDGENTAKQNMTSMDMNMILDSEGQVEDYFNADKNPFTQRQGGDADSVDDLGGFLDKSQKTVSKLGNRVSTNPFGGDRAQSVEVGAGGGEETSEDNEGMAFNNRH